MRCGTICPTRRTRLSTPLGRKRGFKYTNFSFVFRMADPGYFQECEGGGGLALPLANMRELCVAPALLWEHESNLFLRSGRISFSPKTLVQGCMPSAAKASSSAFAYAPFPNTLKLATFSSIQPHGCSMA
eukprot:1687281-Prorocentrum_lima.AAC.1